MTHIKVEITSVVVDADPETVAAREDVARQLTELGHIDAADGTVSTTVTAGWQAAVNGTAMPLTAFSVEPGEDGRVLVGLVVAADEVSVRRSPTLPPASGGTPEKPKNQRATWGQPGVPDPRASILGWMPESSSTSVGNTPLIVFGESSGVRLPGDIRDAATARGVGGGMPA